MPFAKGDKRRHLILLNSLISVCQNKRAQRSLILQIHVFSNQCEARYNAVTFTSALFFSQKRGFSKIALNKVALIEKKFDNKFLKTTYSWTQKSFSHVKKVQKKCSTKLLFKILKTWLSYFSIKDGPFWPTLVKELSQGRFTRLNSTMISLLINLLHSLKLAFW